ncbi:hypothetical protein LTR97_003181 [Elasticomyces elasticus]|uniref:Uncharacterized protein n=1 Tax=Elasticomyces elasticus TaxID=574655 RepID=A0AAN8A3V8_9PEZI|nr:hypothetical protein LTR97_003181 [Elasticomyces elasticus]
MSTDNRAPFGLRPCKRYIATHDSEGKSVYADSPEQVYKVRDAGAMSRSYAVGSIPADLENDADVKAYKSEEGRTSYMREAIVVPGPGANLVVVDLKPGGVSAMHRTVSIDFSICVIGEIDHELDGGEKVRLQPGVDIPQLPFQAYGLLTVLQDHIVQRGTMHRWSNPSATEPARFVACTLPCVPFDIAGQTLMEFHDNSPQPIAKAAKL